MKHEVTLDLCKNSVVPVGSTDIEISVSLATGKLGTLLISKGNIEWMPANKSVNARRFTWRQFADKMKEGKPVKKKKKA
jgi:hypothetical protein